MGLMQTEANTLTKDADFGVFNVSSGTFVLPALLFEMHALVPISSPETLETHLGKHHLAYINAANNILAPMAKKFGSAREVVKFARDSGSDALFAQASQALNHGFFWTCQQAASLSKPEGALEAALNSAYTDFDGFINAATKVGKERVGSGWIWLSSDQEGTVKLSVTNDADTLLDDETQCALLVCDIWEHAYYLDHTSDRPAWIKGFFTMLADWDVAQKRYQDWCGQERITA
jgi:superoxide dismutase, Fe-Mn family